jgi:glycerophosphoryl diester phosphodiesterase
MITKPKVNLIKLFMPKGIEFDIEWTKDKKLIVFHDSEFDFKFLNFLKCFQTDENKCKTIHWK